MKKKRHFKHLPLLFVLAVLIPSVFLSIIAIRAASQEEASIERGLQRSLDAELTSTVSVVRAELGRMETELMNSSPKDFSEDPAVVFHQWKDRSNLVRIPFLLSANFEILWPRLDASPSADDMAFLNWNRDFVTDRAAIPYYQNIAFLYKDQLNEEGADLDSFKTGLVKETAEAEQKPGKVVGRMSAAQPAVAKSHVGDEAAAERPKTEELQVQQRAMEQFEKDKRFREKVFDVAEQKGQKAEPRTVTPTTSSDPEERTNAEPQRSIFISEPKKFSDITSDKDSGIFPRFIEEKLTLMFWRRSPGGQIIGCVLGDDEFRARLLSLLPDVYSPARILTILNENGHPLLTPEEDSMGQRDWRFPFAAREISEILPRWEAAAYLSDPDIISSRAHTTRLILWVLIAIFFLSIMTGGFYVLRSLRSEMALALQKTTFVANVSHELKTPLTSIRMFAEMLKERRQPDREKQEKYLGLMVSETDRLTRLINNVLDFSKMEKGKRDYKIKRLDAAFLVEDMVESQRIRLEHNGFSIACNNDMGQMWVDGDEEALKQAVLNLLSNAEKYSSSDRSIDVEITGTEDRVLINIKDRGIGISPAEAKKIFREFYRADESLTSKVRGSGLGLTISQRIIQDHGGDIRHIPREGGGSIFQLSLPRKGRS